MENSLLLRLKPTIILIALAMCFSAVFSQQKGKASFYSKRANGARTASGSRIHNDSLECAHRTHPFGTLLLVKNPANGKEVVVKVVDRGPHARGRIIDLTHEAARQLGILTQGVAAVEVSVYRKVSVPYPLDPETLPEWELEVSEPGDSLHPEWLKASTPNPSPRRGGELNSNVNASSPSSSSHKGGEVNGNVKTQSHASQHKEGSKKK